MIESNSYLYFLFILIVITLAHPYGTKASIFDDVPRLNKETDFDYLVRKIEESDDSIDNELPSPTITTPLDTVPDVIRLASNKRTKGLIYLDWGETKRGQDLIDSSIEDVKAYVATFRRSSSDTLGTVDITDGVYNDYEHSPLIDL